MFLKARSELPRGKWITVGEGVRNIKHNERWTRCALRKQEVIWENASGIIITRPPTLDVLPNDLEEVIKII